jgi:hypothetical protein
VQGPDKPVAHDPAAVGIRLRRAAVGAAAGVLVAVPGGHAADQAATLPSPFFSVRTAPPLTGTVVATETRFPGRLSSTQAVRVSVDPLGHLFRVVDVDRIGITRKGDYSFVVAAPVEDVRAGAGSGSEPGLRSGAVVWQGFSPGRRLLAAEISLRPRAAASSLPLRLTVDESGVRLVNTTAAPVTTVDANVAAVEIARVLDAARAALRAGTPTPAPVVSAVGPVREVRVVARVPVRVQGKVRFGSLPARKVTAVIGRNPLPIPGTGGLKALDLSVSVPEPASVLRPPGALRWRDLARSGRLPRGREAVRLAANRLFAAALAVQFQEFLANPDANGVARTSYRYVLARQAESLAAATPRNGRSWLVPLGVAIALAVGAVGALVLWAHS